MSTSSSAVPPKQIVNSLPPRPLSGAEIKALDESESVEAVTTLGMYPGGNRITHFGLTKGPTEYVLGWSPRVDSWELVSSLTWTKEDADWDNDEPDIEDVELEFAVLYNSEGHSHEFTLTDEEHPFEAIDNFLRLHLEVAYAKVQEPLLLFDLVDAISDGQ